MSAYLNFAVLAWMALVSTSMATEPIDIGSRRELFVDRFLIDTMDGTDLELHHPKLAETVLKREYPWEGIFAFGYMTVLKDGDHYRLYYRTYPGLEAGDGEEKELTCYAESTDGIHWKKTKTRAFRVSGIERK